MDIETEAKELGWVPKDQFRGDPAKWTDAETFVERGHSIMPILKKNNERLLNELSGTRNELNDVKNSLAEAKEALDEFKKFNEESSKRAYDQAVKDLKDQKRQALREGDADTVMEVDEALETLRDAAPKPLKQITQSPAPAPVAQDFSNHPEVLAWKEENKDWIDVDPQKTAYAASIGSYLRAMNPNLTGRAFLDKLSEKVRAEFPDPNSARTSKTDGAPSRGNSGGGKSYDNLPADAKAACDKQATKLVGPNRAFKDMKAWRDHYVSVYAWE